MDAELLPEEPLRDEVVEVDEGDGKREELLHVPCRTERVPREHDAVPGADGLPETSFLLFAPSISPRVRCRPLRVETRRSVPKAVTTFASPRPGWTIPLVVGLSQWSVVKGRKINWSYLRLRLPGCIAHRRYGLASRLKPLDVCLSQPDDSPGNGRVRGTARLCAPSTGGALGGCSSPGERGPRALSAPVSFTSATRGTAPPPGTPLTVRGPSRRRLCPSPPPSGGPPLRPGPFSRPEDHPRHEDTPPGRAPPRTSSAKTGTGRHRPAPRTKVRHPSRPGVDDTHARLGRARVDICASSLHPRRVRRHRWVSRNVVPGREVGRRRAETTMGRHRRALVMDAW